MCESVFYSKIKKKIRVFVFILLFFWNSLAHEIIRLNILRDRNWFPKLSKRKNIRENTL